MKQLVDTWLPQPRILHLVAFQRMDGSFAEAHRASYGKALDSATTGRPSGDEAIEGGPSQQRRNNGDYAGP
jgi:hypothetical protein